MTTFQSSLKKDFINLATLPIRRKKYSLLKAPMAHKTNALEQYGFKFYYFKVSFSTNINSKLIPLSVDVGALFADSIHKMFPIFSTNTLFLRYYNISFYVKDNNFYNFYNFVTQ